MIGPTCNGCGLGFSQNELKILKKGTTIEFTFCDFCRTSFVSNAIMYPSSVTNKQLIITVAKSHNLIMKQLRKEK
jgi:hypothetical protein